MATPPTLIQPIVPRTVPGINSTVVTDPAILLLANLYVSASSIVDNLTLVDTRHRGGGVEPKSSIRNTTLNSTQKQEANSMWDISTWDGTPTLTNGKIIIKVPSTKLIENGGLYTRDEIDEIIKRNLPVGIYPIVQYT